MEDSFRVRLDKTFGALSSSSSSSSSQALTSSLWCLSDDEIPKRQWAREPDPSIEAQDDDDDDDDDDNFPTNVDKFFKDDKLVENSNPSVTLLDNRNEVKDEGKASSSQMVGFNGGGDEDDELDVRNSIGMDSTLDFEEEEDAYDKVAIGREKPIDDRLYMSDVSDYIPHINTFSELPTTFREASKDPRANHLAAKLRLQEDAETAKSFNSLHVSEQTQTTPLDDENLPKSILKRKDDHIESKTGKRVRFEPTSTSEAGTDPVSEPDSTTSLVPDYVLHPLRYTHYTFDSSNDMNEESNRQAYTEFLNMVKKSKSGPDEDPADLSKPVIFNPKKKSGDQTKEIKMEEPVQKKSVPISISEVSEMEVDEVEEENVELKVDNGKRNIRKYRSKPIEDAFENNES